MLIANPRKLRAIYQHERKSDRRDAQMLARIGRLDPALLYPVRHGTQRRNRICCVSSCAIAWCERGWR